MHTHAQSDEYSAREDLSKLNFPPALLSYFPSASAEENLCGENNAQHTHAMLRFLYPPPHHPETSQPSLLLAHTQLILSFNRRYSFPLLSVHSFSFQAASQSCAQGSPYLAAIAPSTPPSHTLPTPLFFFGSAVRLTNSQRETSAGVAGQTLLPLRPNYTGQSQLPCGQPKHFLG